jgi:hypothetical protein
MLLTLVSAIPSSAQTVRLLSGKDVRLPSQFVVQKDGIRFAPPDRSDVVTLEWTTIDVRALSRDEPMLNEARQKAVLTGKSAYVTVAAPINYLQAFLSLPVDVEFNQRWEFRSSTVSNYTVSLDGFARSGKASDHFSQLKGVAFVQGQSRTVASAINKTRYPLATTIEGLFRMIGDDRIPESARLVRDLQDRGAFFPNLLIGLKNLQRVYPNDARIRDVIKAVERLSSDRAISVDAQREVLSFVRAVRGR